MTQENNDNNGNNDQHQSLQPMDKLLQISNTTNIEDAINWAENANSFMGQSIRLPKEVTSETRSEIQSKLDAHGFDLIMKPDLSDVEQMREFNKMMGMPESADEYDVPEGMTGDQVDAFKEYAHEANLSNDQFKTFVSKLEEMNSNQLEQFDEENNKAMAEIKQNLGYAYDEKIKQADNVLQIMEPGTDIKTLDATALNRLLRAANHFGSLASEGNQFERQGDITRRTTDEAKIEAGNLQKEMMALPPSDPQRKVLQSKIRELFKEAYPGNSGSDGTARVGGTNFI